MRGRTKKVEEKLMKHVKNKRIDIILLLGILLVFSCGISLLYSVPGQRHAVTAINDDEVIKDIQPFDVSQSVKPMGSFIAELPPAQQVRILDTIFNGNKSSLSPEEKLELGLDLVSKRSSPQEQKLLLDLITRYAGTSKVPLLYIAVDRQLTSVVPRIVDYYKNNPALLKESIYKALLHSIKQDNLKNFAQLIDVLKGISKEMATQLLWEVVRENKDAQFIPVLIIQKADLNSASAGQTPLVAAVDKSNVEMIQMLLDNGALPNKFVDPAVGTPLQLALRKKLSTIELLLREHGARE